MDEKKDKYAAQKRYLESKKSLRVWVDAEKYEKFKEAAKRNGTSVYALVNGLIDDYLKQNAGE